MSELFSLDNVIRRKVSIIRPSAPSGFPPGELHLPESAYFCLSSGLPVYALHAPDADFLRVEIAFHAGRVVERERHVARMTARLLREGTVRLSSAAFAEAVERLGAALHIPVSHDYASFSLFCLKRYARESLALFAEMLQSPRFDPDDLVNVAQLTARELEVELAKPEVLTYRALTERLFGADHPYGYNTQPEELARLDAAVLREHWRRFYRADNGALFVCGDLGEGATGMLEDALGRVLVPEAPMSGPHP
ncbi:MAG: M16 family metallopeptidase, partial [Saprospiraceae bacterium]